MDKQYKPTYALLGDIGGTNIRLDLVLIQPPANEPLEHVKKGRLLVKEFDSLLAAFKHFLEGVDK